LEAFLRYPIGLPVSGGALVLAVGREFGARSAKKEDGEKGISNWDFASRYEWIERFSSGYLMALGLIFC